MFKVSRRFTAGVCLLVALVGSAAAADDATPERRATLRQIDQMLVELINHGRDLYNNGEHGACYHVFSGGLRALRPFLSHKPELQKAVTRALADADQDRLDSRRAHTLRSVLDKIQEDLRPEILAFEARPLVTPAKPTPEKPLDKPRTLWERLGKEAGARKIVEEWLTAAMKDEKVNFTRGGKFKLNDRQLADLQSNLVDLASAVSSGDREYRGKRMLEAHKGMKITDAEFDAFVGHLMKALQNNGVVALDRNTIWLALQAKRGDFVQKAAKPAATLWARLGSEEGVTKIVDAWLTNAMNDPKVNFTRDGKFKMNNEQLAALKRSFVKLASSISEGPYSYEGKRMLETHQTMRITDKEYDAFVGHLLDALKINGVQEEDIAAIRTAVQSIRKNITNQ